jgi:hypothetical protein
MVPSEDTLQWRNHSNLERSKPIRLVGAALGNRDHVCAFFNNRDEEYEILTPFIKEGIELGEKAIHTIDPMRRNDHFKRLNSSGIDIESATRSGQFELRDWTNTHLRDGGCDLPGTLALFEELAMDARQDGFSLLRFLTQMEWALEIEMDVDDLLTYEARANDAWLRQDGPINPIVCTYDLSRFSGDLIVDVMRTHPLTIIGVALQENPFFVDPEEFLEKMRDRPRTQLRRLG